MWPEEFDYYGDDDYLMLRIQGPPEVVLTLDWDAVYAFLLLDRQ